MMGLGYLDYLKFNDAKIASDLAKKQAVIYKAVAKTYKLNSITFKSSTEGKDLETIYNLDFKNNYYEVSTNNLTKYYVIDDNKEYYINKQTGEATTSNDNFLDEYNKVLKSLYDFKDYTYKDGIYYLKGGSGPSSDKNFELKLTKDNYISYYKFVRKEKKETLTYIYNFYNYNKSSVKIDAELLAKVK